VYAALHSFWLCVALIPSRVAERYLPPSINDFRKNLKRIEYKLPLFAGDGKDCAEAAQSDAPYAQGAPSRTTVLMRSEQPLHVIELQQGLHTHLREDERDSRSCKRRLLRLPVATKRCGTGNPIIEIVSLCFNRARITSRPQSVKTRISNLCRFTWRQRAVKLAGRELTKPAGARRVV
jgi:hypothetical protein